MSSIRKNYIFSWNEEFDKIYKIKMLIRSNLESNSISKKENKNKEFQLMYDMTQSIKTIKNKQIKEELIQKLKESFKIRGLDYYVQHRKREN